MHENSGSEELDWLLGRLPPTELMQPVSEADYYGASHIIAQALGRERPERCYALWQHGWMYAELTHPHEIAWAAKPDDVCLVGTTEHAEFLVRTGFPNTVAVGLPFVYADASADRRPGTLLVMPPHSIVGTSHQWDEEGYVREIAALGRTFTAIVACISPACIAKNYWTEAFAEHGIPWIAGARPEDRNALRRMANLFSSFDYMTTNTIGSQVAYAAYWGCKVSIYGPYPAWRDSEFESDPDWKHFPEVYRLLVEGMREGPVRKRFPELFCEPDKAVERREWAGRMLGVSNRVPPEIIARLLGWGPSTRCVDWADR